MLITLVLALTAGFGTQSAGTSASNVLPNSFASLTQGRQGSNTRPRSIVDTADNPQSNPADAGVAGVAPGLAFFGNTFSVTRAALPTPGGSVVYSIIKINPGTG